jgi:thiol-disulfide isomerase/thioredoxin
MVQTSVSDGSKLLEYATGVGTGAQSYASPPSIADAASMQMGHPMFCGSLLYKFFGGPGKYTSLVDESKQPVTFGSPETIDGQPCKTIKFYAPGPTYGKTEVAIGAVDGLVRRIRYGSEPLMKMMQSGDAQAAIKEALKSPELQDQLKKSGDAGNSKRIQDALDSVKGAMPTSSLTTELYLHIAVGRPIELGIFSTKAPANVTVQEEGGGSTPQPPAALGSQAPAFTVTSMDGVKHRLSEFKGQVVLIDFWATWCPPCRKGLPETQKFFSDYGKKGLAVLTISDEPKATVTPFLKENKYTFPAYLDVDGATNKTYKIEAIPTTVIIDKSGKLVAYMVGLSPREDIVAALRRAGLVMR